MSSYNYTIHCKSCNKVISETDDSYYGVYAACPYCGWCRKTIECQLDLASLNEARIDFNEHLDEEDHLPILDKLPECKL